VVAAETQNCQHNKSKITSKNKPDWTKEILSTVNEINEFTNLHLLWLTLSELWQNIKIKYNKETKTLSTKCQDYEVASNRTLAYRIFRYKFISSYNYICLMWRV